MLAYWYHVNPLASYSPAPVVKSLSELGRRERQIMDIVVRRGRATAAGHILNTPAHNRFHGISFDGAESTAATVTGNVETAFVASAVWMGDTLVLTNHEQTGGHDFRTIERMTLSPDGNTLLDTNLSFVDGTYRWGGPHAFVLRHITP